MEALMGKCRKVGAEVAVKENVSGFGDEGDECEFKPGKKDIAIEVCGDVDWVDVVIVVIFGSQSEIDAVEGAVDVILCRKDMEKLNEGEFFENIDWGNGRLCCEEKKADGFEDPFSRARAEGARPGEKNLAILWGFGKAREK